MTDLLLALLPTYGLFIIAGITIIAALGIPLPSSIVALTSGGLAATGDLVLLEVLLTTFFAFAVGDQLAFTLGRLAKPEWIESARDSKMIGSLVQRSENFYHKRGLMAILLSRTVMSSIGPYIAYFCGAMQMKRARFTVTAFVGIGIWTTTYVMLGYLFAGNLPQMTDLVAGFLMAGIAALLTFGFAAKLVMAWRRFESE
jgi:membrane protein DedA with SNARE-associated domain